MVASPLSSVDQNNKHDGRNGINERVQIPIIKDLAGEYHITYLDAHLYTATWTRKDIGDRLHRSDSGYEKLAKFFANEVVGFTRNFNGIIEENKNYQIISKSSRRTMTIENYSNQNGAKLVQMEANSYESQCFYFVHTDDGYYQIINLFSEKSLNVFGQSTEEGEVIIQYNVNGEDNEKWIIEAMGDGYWRITPKMSPNMGLNVEGNSLEQGANIVQFPFDGNDNNKWIFLYVDNVKKNP